MMAQYAFPIAVVIALLCYLLIVLLLPKQALQGRTQHLRSAMQRLEEQQKRMSAMRPAETMKPIRSNLEHHLIVKGFLAIPGSSHAVNYIERAGMVESLDKIVCWTLGLWVVFVVLLKDFGALSVLVGAIAALFVVYMYLKMRIKKRRKLFLSMLPDALDIIVRSIKSGYPINAAIGMVADSLPPEVGAEYVRVMNEASYGYSLGEAVSRFADRMQEPDVSFFSVVVNLQQETGGNLTETLGNLSSIIRQRQQLRLKIRALSAEGRATVWILVGIAISMVAVVQFMSPGHFDKLFTTDAGHTIMISVASAFFCAFLFIKRIINFRI